ncbi:MAG: hypothetical protein OTJ98_07875 [Dehalococcoidia bacterium]|nr:hypothetical protein [Dehalococcoidia bacterium]
MPANRITVQERFQALMLFRTSVAFILNLNQDRRIRRYLVTGVQAGNAGLSQVWIEVGPAIEFWMTVVAREFACIGHPD